MTNSRQKQAAQNRRRRKKRNYRKEVSRNSIIAVLVLCFVTMLLLTTAAADRTDEETVVTLSPEDITITEGEAVPAFKVKATCKGDKAEVLEQDVGYTVQDLVDELNQGKGFIVECDSDGTKEGTYPIKPALTSDMTSPLLTEWFGKVKIHVEEGTLTVRNQYGEWDGQKFKRWDGSYVTSDFITYHEKTYYFDADGKKTTGWAEINSNKYYFNKKGVMKTGWLEKKKDKKTEKYYFDDTGVMHVGWLVLDDSKYYFGTDGKMLTGDQKIGSRQCVFADDGKLQSMEGGVDPDQPMMALTFDDGPGPRTEELIKVLKENHARATFFMQGINVSKYPDAIKAMVDADCELGNHSFDHPQLTKLDADGIKKEIGDTNSAISAIVGQSATVMRPPYGAINDDVKANVGLPMILWSIDTLDWKTRDTQQTIDNVLNNAGDGDIVLMHDIHTETVDAAIQLIPKLIEKGYQLVTVSEMAEARGINMENGGKYTNFWKN